MKSIICSPMMLPAFNGTTIYAEQLRTYFKTEVVASNALDWKAVYKKGKTQSKGFKIIRNPLCNNSSLFVKVKNATNRLPALNSLIRGPLTPGMMIYLLRTKWDLIHSLTLPYYNNYIALRTAKLKRKKCVISPFFIKGLVPDSYAGMLKKFDLVMASTEYEKKCLNELGVNNARVSPMCVNPEPFIKASGERFRKIYSISDDEKLVLFFGHANYEKGAYTLLESARKVKARFVFFGARTPGFKSRIKSKNVLLINPQYKNKYDAFKACDVYAMPSRVEAFGITYLEAWASSKPVIAADTPVSREVIGDKGLLVKFDDKESLIKSINESFNRSDLGRAGHNELIKKYAEDKVMSELSTCLQSLLRHHQ